MKALYFSHDSNARNDLKIKSLRTRFKIMAYGVYWVIIETLREQTDYTLPYKPYIVESLAEECGIGVTEFSHIFEYCIEVGLLTFNEDANGFFSESLMRRMEQMTGVKQKLSEAGKKGMANRWHKQQTATPETPASDNPVITPDNNKIKQTNKTNKTKVNTVAKTATAITSADLLYPRMVNLFFEFYQSLTNTPYKFQAVDGKAIKEIISYLRGALVKASQPSTEDAIVQSWNAILTSYPRWEAFHQKQIKIMQISSNLPNIILAIKKPANGNTKRAQAVNNF